MSDSWISKCGSATILIGNCIESLKKLDSDSIQCCVTSPPYWGLRDYGHKEQIGLEKTPEAYVEKIVSVFREVRRVLRPDGTLWLNLGDSYSSAGGSRPNGSSDAHTGRAEPPIIGTRKPTKKPKDLIGIPWLVALALQSDGWWLRQDIIWHKPNAMPESVTDRCTKAHEYIFLLTKSDRYYFDAEAIKEKAVCGSNGSEFHTGKTGQHQLGRASSKPRSSGNKSHKHVTEYQRGDERHRSKAGLIAISDHVYEMRNRRSVWTVSTKPFKGAHFATMPPDLVRPCILAGSREGQVVLDPFAGSGTTLAVAANLGRKAIGCELNSDYVWLAVDRISPFLESNRFPLLVQN